MNVFPISVGQQVYCTPHGNNARSWDGVTAKVGTITRIGRKYFYVGLGSREVVPFTQSTFESRCEDENSHYTLWASIDDWHEFRRAQEEFSDICNFVKQQQFYQNEYADVQVIHKIYQILHEAGLTKDKQGREG